METEVSVPSLTVSQAKPSVYAQAARAPRQRPEQGCGDTQPQARDGRGEDVALRALGFREACNAWVGQVLRFVRSFLCPQRWGTEAVGPSGTRRRQSPGWRLHCSLRSKHAQAAGGQVALTCDPATHSATSLRRAPSQPMAPSTYPSAHQRLRRMQAIAPRCSQLSASTVPLPPQDSAEVDGFQDRKLVAGLAFQHQGAAANLPSARAGEYRTEPLLQSDQWRRAGHQRGGCWRKRQPVFGRLEPKNRSYPGAGSVGGGVGRPI